MAEIVLTKGANINFTPTSTSLTLSVPVDTELSSTSTAPVQNKVIYAALAGKQDKLTAGTGISISGNTISCTVSGGSGGTVTVDSAISSTSTNPVQNKVIYNALAGKQNTLSFDSTPTNGSTKPVTSGGVYTSISSINDQVEGINDDITAIQVSLDEISNSPETWTFTLTDGTTVTKNVYVK